MEVDLNLTYILLFGILGIALFLLHNGTTLLKSLKIFSKHDNSLFDKFLSKYPDVAPEFMKKGIREQNIDNNQEIHAINKRLDANDTKINNIEQSLSYITKILEEMQNGKIR